MASNWVGKLKGAKVYAQRFSRIRLCLSASCLFTSEKTSGFQGIIRVLFILYLPFSFIFLLVSYLSSFLSFFLSSKLLSVFFIHSLIFGSFLYLITYTIEVTDLCSETWSQPTYLWLLLKGNLIIWPHSWNIPRRKNNHNIKNATTTNLFQPQEVNTLNIISLKHKDTSWYTVYLSDFTL